MIEKKQREKVLNFLEKYYELNKKIKKDEELIKNLSEKFTPEQKEQLKKKIKKRIETNRKELNELLQIQLSDVITKTDLGELPDNNSPETILNKLRELNPNLDISKVKVHENSITDTAASIETIDKIYPDDTVKVTFTLTKKTNNSNYPQKQKNDDSENNIGNKKNYPVKNQSIKSVNISGMQNQNNLYDVLPDNSCLFWSVATAYLLPVRNNDEKFKTRFIQLFGEENLKYLQLIQKLLKQYNLENNSNTQLWYQDQTTNNLVTNVFRNRVIDYIQSHLDTIPTSNGELTFRNLIQENNEIDSTYLERMRQPSTWGGLSEIIAMANILNANISVNNDAPYQPINQNSTNTINLFHVNNRTHYNFALTPEDQPNHPSAINDNQKNTPVVDTTNRPNNLQPTNTKSETKVILSNNYDDNQGNNIINPQEKNEN
ncbi:MAG: OTU domain-containing protein [Spiroplasma sp. hy2]|uniref:OTU domain-containing protein n=1 Tax=Spiroplasma sp. hy2 TaxID=2490850 RepID=UPI003848689B